MVSVKKMAEQREQILKKGNKMKGNTPTHTHTDTHSRREYDHVCLMGCSVTAVCGCILTRTKWKTHTPLFAG